MTQYRQSGTNIIIFGNKVKNGKINIAGYVELYRPSTNQVIAKTSTDINGRYEFVLPYAAIPSDVYYIRFYGSGMVQSLPSEGGDWEIITITQVIGLTISTLPIITISEEDSILEVNNVEQAVADVATLSMVASGVCAWIDVQLKESTALEYSYLGTYPFAESFRITFPLTTKEVNYDFRFLLRDAAGAIGKTNNGDDAVVDVDAIILNGIADLGELHEVYSLACTNAEEGGTLITDFISLKWFDFQLQGNGFFHADTKVRNGYTGEMKLLNYKMSRKIKDYWIYMFIADTLESSIPGAFFPRGESGWYLAAKTKNCFADVRVPRNKWVSFWVGFSMGSPIMQITDAKYEY